MPLLDEVARNIAPGRQARLNLTAAQRTALADPDGRLALAVYRHLIGARRVTPGAPVYQMPFTPEAVRRVALRLGHGTVGRRHARALRDRLVEQDLLVPDGSYRPDYRNQAGDAPHRVPLYKIGRHLIHSIVRRARNSTPPAISKPLGSGQAGNTGSRGRGWRPKRRYWRHELFGDRSPPDVAARVRARMLSDDERSWTWK